MPFIVTRLFTSSARSVLGNGVGCLGFGGMSGFAPSPIDHGNLFGIGKRDSKPLSKLPLARLVEA